MNNDTKQYISKCSIPGVLVIERPQFADNRGSFHEIFRMTDLEAEGISFSPVQWNHSISLPRVIRALHSENWYKLVYPVTGKTFIAIADVRSDSDSFGKVETFVFDNTQPDSPRQALFLPPGVGNSICVMGDEPVHYMYLVADYWENSKATGIAWNDPDLAIKWPVENPILSERDQNNPTLRELYPEKFSK